MSEKQNLIIVYQKPNNSVCREELPIEWKEDPDLKKSIDHFRNKGYRNIKLIDPNTNEETPFM